MNITRTLLLLAALPAAAQTSTKPAVHHTASPARKPAAAPACPALPTLGAAIPKLPGCPKALYALQYIDTVIGTGAPITPRKFLTVNYTGYLLDGTKFDTSLGMGNDGKPKEPITFPYGARQVIAGWDTGFEGMNVGGKRRLFIPYQLAYGELGRPPVIPVKAELVFDIELVAISDTPPAPKTPPSPPPPPAGQAPPAGAPAKAAPPASAIPPTTAPPATQPATDPTRPTAIPPTTAPPASQPATSPKPTAPPVI